MSKRILVVEDQADERQIVRDVLAGRDYEITQTKRRKTKNAAAISKSSNTLPAIAAV